MNIFVKNNHLLAKLRSVLKEHINLTSSKHKETILGARKKHKNIKRLVTKLGEVLDPHSSGPAKNIKSGVLLDDLIEGLLKSDEIVEKHLQDFILKRIKVNENDAVSFFVPIKNPKLKTGLEVKV